MKDLLRLLFVVPLGFILACIAAGLTVAVAVFGMNLSPDAVGWIIIFMAWTAAYAGALAFVPWLAAVILAEGFAWRSVFYWLAVGGGIGLAAYRFTDFIGNTPSGDFGLTVHLAAGFVGGFVYWLVAGRSAGFARPSPVCD